jgi:hypothetical protein
MLVDPYTPIHFYSGILPIQSIQIPEWSMLLGLKKMSKYPVEGVAFYEAIYVHTCGKLLTHRAFFPQLLSLPLVLYSSLRTFQKDIRINMPLRQTPG